MPGDASARAASYVPRADDALWDGTIPHGHWCDVDLAGSSVASAVQELVRRHFLRGAQLYDSDVVEYVSGVLTDFAHVDNLYRIRNARGRRLEEVAEMLVESNPLLDAPSFDREREVRKHIGDFTLFEQCAFGLNLVKREMEQIPDASYRRLRTGLGLDSR